jgi:hypothetical protein
MSISRLALVLKIVLFLLLITACQKSINLQIQSEVPPPLVTKIPLSVGVYYTKRFREFTYTENSKTRGRWHIASGLSQVKTFSRILDGMFTDFHELDSAQTDVAELVVIPEIAKMQFATPEETGFEFFEAWVEYVLTVKTNDGKTLPEWRFTGYGQAIRQRFSRFESGLTASFDKALRNAGAQLATGFPEYLPIRQKIQQRDL